MKITEIKSSQLPLRVKLNKNFTLDESFDFETILQINSYAPEPDIDGCFKVWVTALVKDMEHNKSVAERNWLDKNTGRYDIDIFEANKSYFDKDGNFRDVIFVMDTDDCFDVITELPKYSINDILLIVSEIAPGLKPHITETNVDQFIEGLKRKK